MSDEMTTNTEVSNEGSSESTESASVNLQQSGEGGEQTNPTDAVLEKLARKYKVKLDGEELEVDEDELIRGYQLRKVSDKRLQEGVMARKQAESFIQMLKTDPKRVLSDPRIGLDVKKLAEDIIYEQLQHEMMTPEQRELMEYKRKVQSYEAQQKKIEDEKRMTEENAVLTKQRDAYVQDISEALENAGLPKNDYTVQRVVHEMTKAIRAGFGNVTAKDVIDLVHAQFIKDTKALYGSSNEETLMKLLGDEVAGKIRNYDVNKFKEKNKIPQSNNVKVAGKPGQTAKKKQDKVMTPSQLRAKIESEFGIG
jgi:hypothetical protein